MSPEQNHEGAYEAVLYKLNHFDIPQAKQLKSKLSQGKCLNEFDIEHLKSLIDTAAKLKQIQRIDQRNEKLSQTFIFLLNSISKKALINEITNSHQKD